MGQLITIFTLAWIAFTICSIQANNGPELNLPTPSVTALANGTFEVECSGYYPVQWIYPVGWRSLISPHAQVNDSYHPNRTKPYVSTLTIENLEYRFTGRYLCYSTIGPRPDEANFQDDIFASIYLYVYDENHLLAPMTNRTTFPSFAVVSSSTLTIPCRPTRPEITVQLIGNGNVLGTIFDPSRGFIFEHPTADLNGIFHCIGTYDNRSETQIFFLYFQDDSTELLNSPVIDVTAANYPKVGEPFALNCITYKSLNQVMYISWTYPAENDDIEVMNTTVRQDVLESGQKVHRLSTKLEVSSATKNHTGNYTCTVTTIRRIYSRTVYLIIHDDGPELNLVTPTVTLLANSTFEVECSSYHPVQWIYPPDWSTLITSHAQVNESYHPNRTKPYVSTLTVVGLEYRFTGRYICASTIGTRPNVEDFQDDISASIYLYVYDGDHLFAPLTNKTSVFPYFAVFSNNTLIIPCRPTRPEITVEFIGDGEAVQGAVFDSHRGFIFERPTSALEGISTCIGSYENRNETLFIHLRFIL